MLLFSVILLIAVTVVFTLSIRPKDVPPADPPSPTRHLEERKAAIYENLRDLQFEYRVGKLSDDDYQRTKLALQKELAVVLAAISAASGTKPAPPPQPAAAATAAPAPATGSECPHCHARFPCPMKFCAECGKAMG